MCSQIDAVLASVSAAGDSAQVQEGRRRLHAQRHPQEVQREAVEAALLEGGLLQRIAAQGVLLPPPQPQGKGLPGGLALPGVCRCRYLRVRAQSLHADQDDGGGRRVNPRAAALLSGGRWPGELGAAAASQARAGMLFDWSTCFPAVTKVKVSLSNRKKKKKLKHTEYNKPFGKIC